MFWSLTSPAVIRQGETDGALTLLFDDIPGTPITAENFSVKFALFPWNGDPGPMDYAVADDGNPVTHTSPHTGESYWSLEVELPKDEIPDDIPPGLYYLSIQFIDSTGPAISYPLPKRAIAITIEEEFEVAAP